MNSLLTSSLLTALLQSSLLVTGAWLLILTQRRTSAARRSAACRFTMAAALVLVAVTIGNMAFSLIPDSKPSIAIAPATLPQGAGTMAESILLNPESSPAMERQRALPLPLPVIPAKDPQSNSSWTLPSAHARWLAFGWLTGSTLVLTVWLSSLAARLTLLRHSQKAAGVPWLQIAREVKSWPLVDEVRLVPQDITPCVWGVRKTVLALPASAASWPAAKLKLVLAHECAHLFRRDPLWQILGRFFLALLWFHPLAWNLARRSKAAEEQAADDIVLRTECDAPSYADLLVECARQFSLPPALQTTASAMAGPGTLTRRVEAVLNPATDRRPANSAGLFTWAVLLALLTVVSMQAAPEISTKQDQPSEVVKTDAEIPVTETQPVVPPIAETPKPDFKVSGDTVIFPPEKPADRKTYIFKGSVKLRGYEFSISADEVKAEWKAGQNPADLTKTINPGNLTSVVASGSVVVEGKFAGSAFSGKADSAVYTPNPPGQSLILSGWSSLLTDRHLIEGRNQNSKIVIGPGAILRSENCTIATVPKAIKPTPEPSAPIETPPAPPAVPPNRKIQDVGPTESPAETPSETTPTPNHEPKPAPAPAPVPVPETQLKSDSGPESPASLEWKIITNDGLEYIPASKIKAFYKFPKLELGEAGSFSLSSNTMRIAATTGSNEIRINNVRFFTEASRGFLG